MDQRFLSYRLQRVVIEGIDSNDLAVFSGVSQGSVLGPSMFLVYINDISDILQSSSNKLLADDSLLYRPVNTLQDSVKFQKDLASLEQWASQ